MRGSDWRMAAALTAILVGCGGEVLELPLDEAGGREPGAPAGSRSSTGGAARGSGLGGTAGVGASTGGDDWIPLPASGGAPDEPATGGSTATGGSVATCRLPSSPLVIDFDQFDSGDSLPSGAGHDFLEADGSGMSGGSFLYEESDACTLSATVTDEGGLRLSANLPDGGWSGYGLWFQECIDARQYTGVAFGIAGGSDCFDLEVQLQHVSNQPESDRGSCVPTSPDTKWNDCRPAAHTVEVRSGTVHLPFAEFQNGAPSDGVNPAELLAVQFQVLGDSEDCAAELTIDDVTFY